MYKTGNVSDPKEIASISDENFAMKSNTLN